MPHLIVIYGAPLTGKSSLARVVAGALDGKAAIVSTDAMLHDAIRVHDDDVFAELEMVHIQARLLVANYLKNRYHVVLEGAFNYDRDGARHRHEEEIDQILGLMRNLAWAPLLVRLSAGEDTLRRRAQAGSGPREYDVEAALRIETEYRQRYGNRSLVLSTDDSSIEDLSAEVIGRLADS
jgi:hypothetical protein